MRIALVHDDLVQWGGAERVLEGLCEIYPDASIFTSIFDYQNKELVKKFGRKKIITSFLQNIPGWRNLYKILLPLYPIAFEQFNFDGFDLVISHTTRFAKSIITKPQTKHISYCHTPPRFLWHFSSGENFKTGELLLSKLRIYDQISSRRVDSFVAGSKNAQRRIKKVYRIDSAIVYPFVDLERFKSTESFDGGYFLVITRLNKYKRVDLAIDACMRLNLPLKVIGIGSQLRKLEMKVAKEGKENLIEFLGNLDDKMVAKVLAGCRALIIPGVEDFGLTSLEAQALGKYVIAYKEGGVLETVIDSQTGFFFEKQNVESLISTLSKFNYSNSQKRSKGCVENANKFSKEKFMTDFKQTVASLLYTN